VSALGIIKWKRTFFFFKEFSFLFKARCQTFGNRWERRFLSSEKSFPGSRVKSLCAHPGVAPTQWLEWNFWLIFVVKQQKNKKLLSCLGEGNKLSCLRGCSSNSSKLPNKNRVCLMFFDVFSLDQRPVDR